MQGCRRKVVLGSKRHYHRLTGESEELPSFITVGVCARPKDGSVRAGSPHEHAREAAIAMQHRARSPELPRRMTSQFSAMIWIHDPNIQRDLHGEIEPEVGVMQAGNSRGKLGRHATLLHYDAARAIAFAIALAWSKRKGVMVRRAPW